jgi:transcriptional regulator with AAA-type ATPase domain/tetratricopeptide (TPR) repeat protein
MDGLVELLGESPAMQAVGDKLRRLLARQRAGQRLPTILLQGETGTGKGLAAHVLHRHSVRRLSPFMDVNCAAIPETLLEAELFGFERGAFTDARQAKPGLFQAAHGGVLFLDEVGLLAESMQAKLLTVIEERSVRRLGSTRAEPADVWLISATNSDLQAAVSERRFRGDLYHRLAVITLDMPPLRDRGRDVLLLARRFLHRACAEYGLPPRRLDTGAETLLLKHSWPGNVRELMNVIERAALFSETPVVTADVLGPLQSPDSGAPRARAEVATRAEAMRQQLLETLEETGWNISHAAARLGVARNTVYARLEKLGLRSDPPSKAGAESKLPFTPGQAPPVPSHVGLSWERRSIALLRAELESAESVDAWSRASRTMDALIAKILSFGGRLEEVTPTGLVAAFGIERAEDAPRCAAHAAIAIQGDARRARELDGSPVAVRIGLHVAPLLIGRIGTRIEIDAVSKRAVWPILDGLLQERVADETIASAAAAAFLERRFDLVRIGAPGEREPAYRLTGQERRGLGLWGTLTRFVGRREESALLRGRLTMAEGGRGQVAAVVGEAGVGKSRLIHEFAYAHRPEGWRVLEGTSVSYGQAMSYLPVVDLLKQYFAVQDRDHPHEIREKIAGRLLALDAALQSTLPAFQALLDVPVDDEEWRKLDPALRRQRTLEAVKRVLLREAREQPLLLIFEDLHWIDRETQALLDTLTDSLGSARLLILTSYRPEYHHLWSHKTYYTQLRLDSLPLESAGELLEALLGGDPSLAPLKNLLVKRGNPFFLEETVRTLVETGALEGARGQYRLTKSVQAIRVPATVEAILAARIDRLSPGDKRLLQIASVVGRTVPLGLLRALADLPDAALRGGLDSLQSAELLYENGLDPDREYAFKHALTHEVAYSGLPPARRRELHAEVVRAIEALHPDRLDEHIERLAHHALLGELKEKAVIYLRRAGNRAAARSALADARDWYEQALALLDALPGSPVLLEQAFEIRLELRPVLTQLGEPRRVLERLREAEALAVRLHDERRRGRSWALMAGVHSQLGELDEGLVAGARALEIAERLGDLSLRILATSYLELVHYWRGDYERAVELATQNLASLPIDWTYEHLGNTAPASVFDRHFLVMSLAELGRFDEARAPEAEGMRLVEPVQHAFTVGLPYYAAGTRHLLAGDWARARALIERVIGVFRTGNVVFMLPYAVVLSAWALAQLGETSEVLGRLQEGQLLLDRLAATGIVSLNAWAYNALGRACLAVGRLDEARRLGERTIESLPSHRGFAAHALQLLGDIATHPERLDAEGGEAYYRRALALAEARGMRPLVAHCHFGLGRLFRRTDRHEPAREHLNTAVAMYRDMGMSYWLLNAERERTELG